MLKRLTIGIAAVLLASIYFLGINQYLMSTNVQIELRQANEQLNGLKRIGLSLSDRSIMSWDPELLAMLSRQSFHNSFNNVQSTARKPNSKPLVLLYTQYYDFKMWPGFDECPSKCEVTNDKKRIGEADMVIFQGWKRCDLNVQSPTGVQCQGWDMPNEVWNWPARNIANQTWMYMTLESQQNTGSGERLKFADNLFNYTMSFKQDSTLYHPYGEITRFTNPDANPHQFDANTKSKLLLWLVSHCSVKLRDDYARELGEYIQLDEFGKCSGKSDGCTRGDKQCVDKLKQEYKFYLSFENSMCDGYITEKFWKSLSDGMVPVILGPSKEQYERQAPPHSFIHIEDFSGPEQLAEYLILLDRNDEEYNKYHVWRQQYATIVNWMNKPCEVCRLASQKPHSLLKLSDWWNMQTQCTNITKPDLIQEISETLDKPIYL